MFHEMVDEQKVPRTPIQPSFLAERESFLVFYRLAQAH